MPGLHSAHIVSRMLESLDVGTVLGPILMGLEKPVEIVHMNSTVRELVNASAFAAHESMHRENDAKAKPARKSKAIPRKAAE